VLDDSEFRIADEQELQQAYDDPASVVLHGDHLYISGTRGARDVMDDLLIPFHAVHKSERYGQALAALKKAKGRVKYLVGHSLGGAISARLLEDHPEIVEARAYGAPLLRSHATPRLRTFRRAWDPVSMFDGSASTTQAPTWNPHSYTGFKQSTQKSLSTAKNNSLS